VQVTIDGYVFEQQSHGGISRIYHEMLPLMCALDDDLTLSLVTCGRLLQALPSHARITHRRLWPIGALMQPERLWAPWIASGRRLVQERNLDAGEHTIWLSTYYTSPPGNWPGRRLAVVYDLIPDQFRDQYRSRHAECLRTEKRRAVEQSDAVLCISEATRQALLETYRPARFRTRVVHLATGASFEPAAGNVPAAVDEYLLYVGGRSGYKSFDLVLQALAGRPPECGERLQLIAVGKPWSRTERRRIAQLGLVDVVSTRCGVDDEALADLYRGAAALVYPSLAEGFGIPLLEAMTCGCPVVASRIPVAVEVAGDVPLYFAPGNVESLTQALCTALREGRAEWRVAAGRDRAATFTWEATARGVLEVLRALA